MAVRNGRHPTHKLVESAQAHWCAAIRAHRVELIRTHAKFKTSDLAHHQAAT
ncbi:hypothetical protein ABT119_31320 [Streptomyces sp. NPDC001910]|uniref:hypothetical protein n=1 Tax=Streptomyces sp. NPDC001910 TaxID=3154403 RepID=UPI003318B30F